MKKIGNLDKLMAEIANLIEDKIRDDEFTLAEFINKFNISIARARTVLGQQVKDGVLKKRKTVHEGRLTNVYSDAKPKA